MKGDILSGAAIALAGLAAAGAIIACRYFRVRAALGPAARGLFKRRSSLFLGACGLAAAAFTAFSGSLALPAAPALILGIVAFRAFIREAGKGER
jgi:hypothetical protein